MLAGAAAALGASSCCVLPLALVTLGVGSAWLARLRARAVLPGVRRAGNRILHLRVLAPVPAPRALQARRGLRQS